MKPAGGKSGGRAYRSAYEQYGRESGQDRGEGKRRREDDQIGAGLAREPGDGGGAVGRLGAATGAADWHGAVRGVGAAVASEASWSEDLRLLRSGAVRVLAASGVGNDGRGE